MMVVQYFRPSLCINYTSYDILLYFYDNNGHKFLLFYSFNLQ